MALSNKGKTDATPLTEGFGLDAVMIGLSNDLNELRAGKISVDEARARAELSKQFMNGLRLYIKARQFLEREAKAVNQIGDRKRGQPKS